MKTTKGVSYADAAEGGDKNTEISDAAKMDAVMDMIRDACAKMDSVSSRMDAIEDAQRRSDAARKDETEEEKEKSEAKADEDDKERKDADDKDEKEGRKDAEEEAKEAKADADKEEKSEAEADSAAQMREMRAQIAALQQRAPALINSADRERLAAIQEQADPVFQAFSDRAPAPLDGETPTQYKRRLAAKMQGHSTKWKDARLSSISDESMLDTVISDVYADALSAARAGADVPFGQLRPTTRTAGGHTFIEYHGSTDAWMNSLAGNAQRATGDWRRPH